ncbi:PREDICTED: probable ADP-ribosylation factor GTPase-activating protein AGD14 isoform X1 [Ipomoea nil]|uniref:probable ADP-ribosylation factor GTPase-activating protein AGD14 isoform X1 n=1 Tax=Ipomoea nil TaxID=35883 RepID=UPI0009011632|nr:PREDICTED: probable ADP-ribosylation factor GTPase-activating protein AGD14 isoform X1 [Ipomoea nil]XP_019151569.1 PREDICTED: probable ADP-ribosylation factor GTPase-activating protein AGD14 isoform X1 [Ipomoea nil]
MAGRLKEDERNERVIRGLLKLPENRRCINCNSLGPQYVCINFWTFVCTTCSGIHREFTHRVKSISMAKFTSQEVSALQGGGNASAKEIYLKEWDPQNNSFPDGSNVERLRNFIKHVYVDRRYSGERRFEKPPRGKSETEDLNKNRRVDTYRGGSRSPPYEDRYNDKPISGGRSPGYDQENQRYNDYKRSPARAEVINDWQREDRFGNGRRSEENQSSDGSSTFESKSPDRQRDFNSSSPPMVRPVRDILGENVAPLPVIEPPKESGGRSTNVSVQTQRTASSSSLASSNGNPTEIKTEMSLIDFDADPEPVSTAAAPKTQQSTTATVSLPILSGADNWANFDSLQMGVSPSHTNPLDVLSDLVTPAPISSHLGGTPSFGNIAPVAAALGNSAAFSPDGTPAPATATGPTSHAGGQWSNMQPQHPSLFPPTVGPVGQSILHHSAPVVGGPSSNQPWNPLAALSTQGLQNAATTQVPQTVTTAFEATPGVAGISSSAEVKSMALPEDLFSATYLPMHTPIPGWYAAPPHRTGLTMQYNIPAPTTFAPPIKSSNPFDTPDDSSPLQASTMQFPSLASVQGALPNIEVSTGLQQPSSLGTVAPHPFAMPQQAPSYALPSNSSMGQQVAGSMPQKPHGLAGFGLDGAAFGAISTNLQLGGLDSAPTAQNTFSYAG